MKTFLLKNKGWITYFTDYVRITRSYDSVLSYDRSDEYKQDFNKREIAVFLDGENNVIISTAVSPSNRKLKKGNVGHHIAKNRLLDFINHNPLYDIGPEDKGRTWVPFGYKELLVEDPYTYGNIFGPLSKSMLDSAVNFLKNQKTKEYNYQVRKCYKDKPNDL